MAKNQYRVRNWKDYNKSLEKRGSIEIWIDKKIFEKKEAAKKNAKKGRPEVYKNALIECMLAVKFVYSLGFRQLKGFMKDVVKMMGLNCDIPDYSTVCRRQKNVSVEIVKKCKSRTKLYLAIDSSGLKIFGEGEWKVRQHGYSKRRTWKKLHIGLGILSGNKTRIEVAELTEQKIHDTKAVPKLLKNVKGKVGKILGDGAYNAASSYEEARKIGAKMIAPPREKAKTQYVQALKSMAIKERNRNIRIVHKFGLKHWKKKTHYHKRSLVENAFFRLKTIFGGTLAARKFENQQTEALMKCQILNRMTEIGMPKSYAVV